MALLGPPGKDQGSLLANSSHSHPGRASPGVFDCKTDSSLLAYGSISYFLLLLIAGGFVISNAIRNRLGSRSFWVLLAIGYSLWALDHWIFLYHQFVLHTDVPDSSIADPVLFLHLVPFTAAVASLLTLQGSPPKLYRVISNFLLLLFSGALVLIAAVGILSPRVQYPWKMIYLHLLGASALYALSSAVANTAIDTGGYVSGKIYGLGLTASACWFVRVPIRARQITGAEIKRFAISPSVAGWMRLSAEKAKNLSKPSVWPG